MSESSHPESRKDVHPSFHQRLREKYGDEAERLDPGIELQSDLSATETEVAEPEPKSSGTDSSTSRALFHKLTDEHSSTIRYKVGHEVGRGGMGTVLRVWDQDLRRTLAMKILTSTPASSGPIGERDEERLSRFLEEAQITGQLDHPGIVPVHDLGIGDDGRLYFTMRLVRGRELKEILDLARSGDVKWTTTKVISLLLKVCEAMAFAHSKGVVHRDLKPSNIMVGRFGEVYVMDWGLARVLGDQIDKQDPFRRARRKTEDPSSISLVRTVRRDESELDPESPLITLDGDVVGTPSFMALEQAQGKLEELGASSDVYSLGGVLYYMLTGRAPYVKKDERVSPHVILQRVLAGPPESVTSLEQDASPELVAICEKAMARHADDRYRSMLEVHDDLEAYLDGRVVSAYEGGAIAEFRKWVSRNRGMAMAIAGLVLLVLTSIGGFALMKGQQLDELAIRQAETQAEKEKAERNGALATAAAKEAKENFDEAEAQRVRAERQADLAARESEVSRRTSYLATLAAADFSLQLEDTASVREHLERSLPALRGWEWEHLKHLSDGSRRGWSFSDLQGAYALSIDEAGRQARIITVDYTLVGIDLDSGELAGTTMFSWARPRTVLNIARIVEDVRGDVGVLIRPPSEGEGDRPLAIRRFGQAQLELPPAFYSELQDRIGTALEVSPDGTRLAIGFQSGELIVLELDTLKYSLFAAEGVFVRGVSWSPDGRSLLMLLEGGGLRIVEPGAVNAAASATSLSLPGAGNLSRVVWSGDGRFLLTVFEGGSIDAWNRDGTFAHNITRREGTVTAMSARGPHLAVGYADGLISLGPWAVDGGMQRMNGHVNSVVDLEFFADEKRLLSLDSKGSLKEWDVLGDVGHTARGLGLDQVYSAKVNAAKDLVALAGEAGFLGLFDAGTGHRRRRLVGHDPEKQVTLVTISQNGERVLSAAADGTSRLWDATSGDQLALFRDFQGVAKVIALSDERPRAYLGTNKGVIHEWNTRTGELVRTYKSGRRRIRCLALDESRGLLFAGTKHVDAWDLETGELIQTIKAPLASSINALVVDPSGEWLYTGSASSVVRRWKLDLVREAEPDFAEGTTRHTRKFDEGAIRHIGIHPDGRRLVVTTARGALMVLNAETLEVLLQRRSDSGTYFDAIFRATGGALTAVSNSGQLDNWWSTGRVELLERIRASEEDTRYCDQILRESLDRCTKLAQLPRVVQERTDLTPNLRSQVLADAEWMSLEPYFADDRSQTILMEGDVAPAQLERLVSLSTDLTNRISRSPRLELTLAGALIRSERYEEALDSLERVAKKNQARGAVGPDRPLTSSERRARRLMVVQTYVGLNRLGEARESWVPLNREIRADPSVDRAGPLWQLLQETSERLGDL